MDVYKYQIWTCNIPGVYTPGCNDAFVMSSTTTATTAAQAQMANLQPMAVPAKKIPSSQYKTKLYGPPQSPSGMPAPNPCAGDIRSVSAAPGTTKEAARVRAKRQDQARSRDLGPHLLLVWFMAILLPTQKTIPWSTLTPKF